MQANEFLIKLRERTASSHEALEQIPLSVSLMSNEVNQKLYASYLETLYGFVKGFEVIVYPRLLKYIPDIAGRQKAGLLNEDLRKLGRGFTEINMISDNTFKTIYHGDYAALGGMYVLEGSTLGGQIISRHLEKMMGSAIAGKLNYFKAYGQNTGIMWKSFLEKFCIAVSESGRQEEVIESAIQTFKLLEVWMTSGSINELSAKRL